MKTTYKEFFVGDAVMLNRSQTFGELHYDAGTKGRITEFLPTLNKTGARWCPMVELSDGKTADISVDDIVLAPITLYSSIVEDYDQLRKDYLSSLDENEEPTDDGHYDMHNLSDEMAMNELHDETIPTIVAQRPDSLYLCVGTSGGWRGRSKGGKIASDLEYLIRHLSSKKDEFVVTLENGHLNTKGYHHDGTNVFDIYRLNDKGERLYNKESSRMDDEELHDKLTDSYYHIDIKNPFR